MPSSRRTRREPVEADYEVVDDPPKRLARVLAVKAAPSSSDDPGFEVVDETEAPAPRKKRVVAAVEDDDDTVDERPSRRRDETDDDEPVKKKKKRRRSRSSFDDDEKKEHNSAWWVVPVALIVVGLILSIVGSMGYSAKQKNPQMVIGTGIVLAVTLVQFVVSIPISIVALIVGGKLFGIEYGTPLMAVANIAAIGSMVTGIDWFLTWMGLWPTAIHCITAIICFSMFMTLFQLDSHEVWISLFFIKATTFLSYIVVFVFVLAMLMGGGKDPDFNNAANDDDDRPQLKQNDGKGNAPHRGGNRPRDPDDDDN